MNTAVINVKVNPEVKKDAQKIAEQLGFSLSGIINGYLRQFIRTKAVRFNLEERPTEYMIKSLKESEEDIRAGRVTTFKTGSEALDYLDQEIADERHKQHSH